MNEFELAGSLAGVLPSGVDALVLDALPANPLHTLEAVALPTPPRLTLEQTPAQRAVLVVRAYLGSLKTIRRRTKLWWDYRCDSTHTPDITASKSYDKLKELADLFVEHELSPFAWAAWRLRVAPPEPKAVPGLYQVLSKTWLAKPQRRGWFRRDTADMYRVASIEPPACERLRNKWEQMLAEVYASNPSDVAMVRAIFETHFPGEALRLMTRRAAEQTNELRAQYAQRVSNGEWLW